MQHLAHLSVESLIPHRPPMQLLSRVLCAGPEEIWSCVVLDRNAPFVAADQDQGLADGQVAAVITLEYMAQTAAAFFSVQALGIEAEPAAPRPGMLIGCSQLSCTTAAIAIPTTVAVQASLASALPASADASALVRFTGKVFDLQSATDPDADPAAIVTVAATQTPIAEAVLSVFLPAAGKTQ
ncbi:MAG: hypothetical protein AB8B93_10525 [Pseudomonadales bacterium]